MTLPSSGQISIAQMRNEYNLGGGGVSMNQFYGKPGLPGSGALSFSAFHGKSNYILQRIVHCETIYYSDGEWGYWIAYGFDYAQGGFGGSMDDRWFPPAGLNIYAFNTVGGVLAFTLQGSAPNSGWTGMVVNGYNITRASGGYYNGGSITQWTWSVGYDVFPGSGSVSVGWY